MSVQPIADSLPPMTHRVATFVPSSLPADGSRVTPVVPQVAPLRYQVTFIGQDRSISLPGDPMVPHAPSMMRMVSNVIATFALILFTGLAVVATGPRLFGYESVVVTSGSMEPSVRKADVVVTAASDGRDLGEGAVINFERNGERVLHRIVVVTPNGYRTAGDANNTPDSELVTSDSVRGIGIVVVPFAGLPATWAAEGQWLLLGLALTALIACLYMTQSRWVEPRRDLGA